MNRREALAALLAIPEVGSISRLTVQPGQVIVVECPMRLTEEQATHIYQRLLHELRPIFPQTKILVLSEGITLKVVDQGSAE
jgi:hypothetical protein